DDETFRLPTGCVQVQLSAPLVRALSDAALDHETNLNSILVSAWAVVVGQWADKEEVAISVKVFGEDRPSLDSSQYGGTRLLASVRVPVDQPFLQVVRTIERDLKAVGESEVEAKLTLVIGAPVEEMVCEL